MDGAGMTLLLLTPSRGDDYYKIENEVKLKPSLATPAAALLTVNNQAVSTRQTFHRKIFHSPRVESFHLVS
jgi:hypothetical protein